MIFRLEGKTAILQSRLDEHHKSLEKNRDILDNLESFSRMIKTNGISIDGNKVTLQSGQSTITLQNNNIDISSNGDIAIGTPTKSFVHIQKDGNIFIGPDNARKLVFDIKGDIMTIFHDGATLDVGKTNVLGGKKKPGVLMKSPNGNMIQVLDDGFLAGVPGKSGSKGDYKIAIIKDKGVMLRKGESEINLHKDDIKIEAKENIDISSNKDIAIGTPKKSFVHIQKDGNIFIGPENTKGLVFDIKEDLMKIFHDGAILDVGKTNVLGGKKKPGVLMKSPNGNMIQVLDDGFLAGVPGKSGSKDDYKITIIKDRGIMLRKGESKINLFKNDISIEAVGDINITSKNGNVNINGMKVSLNE
jgi:hypothetical protein